MSEFDDFPTIQCKPGPSDAELEAERDIKHAVEKAFKVKVVRVNTLHVRGKARRQRTAQAGTSPAWKKAVVTLKAGDKIELT